MTATPMLPGFKDPVHDAQRTFRAVLEAVSRPGSTVRLTALPPAPEPLTPAMVALALTLCDTDTPVWLDPAAATEPVRRHLRFHCGCPLAASPGQAAFAFICDPAGIPRLAEFSQGEAEYPERSATLIVATSLAQSAAPLRISGPGIQGLGALHCPGLPQDFWAQRRECRAYPLGVDLIFVNGTSVCAMPRTTAVEDKSCM